MPRQPRYLLAGVPQHIVQRGNNRQATFFEERDYHQYLDSLGEAAGRYGCAVHAYVLMSNHVHLLATPSRSDGIAKMMQSVGRYYVRYLNDTYRRTGTLWEGRYKACLVDTDYLLTCYYYVELNPVRANVSQSPADYPWSSYGTHALGTHDPVISDHAQYLALGRTLSARRSAYVKRFPNALDPITLRQIRETSYQCLVLGGEQFKDEVERMLARKVRPGKVGRPRKESTIRA